MTVWYYAVGNEQKGPVTEADLKIQFATNRLTGETLIWKEGMDNWLPASQVPGFILLPPPLSPVAAAPVASSAPPSNPASTEPVTMSSLWGTPEALEVDIEDAEKNKMFGVIAYLPFLWLVPLLAAPRSPFAKYHANQGLTLFILELIVYIVLRILEAFLNFVNLGFVQSIVGSLCYLVIISMIILGLVNSAQGKCVPLPVIGGIKLLK